MEWIGSAAVLSLSSPLILACSTDRSSGSPGSQPESDASGPRSGKDAAQDLQTSGGNDSGADLPAAADSGVQDRGGADPGRPAGTSDSGGADPGADSASPDPGGSDPGRELEVSEGTGLEAGCPAELEPGATDTHAVFDGWGERTVDPQELADLIAGWDLSIEGMVETPLRLGFCDLLELGLSSQVTDFHCVEGWSIYDVPWDGVPLAALLERAGVKASATHLKIVCETERYTESLPLDIAREPKTMLALGINGHTMPLKHGFPARIVVPRLLGYKNPKYVRTIEVVDYEHVGYWSNYGYPVAGVVPEQRLREGKY
jgi:hypothetical protein